MLREAALSIYNQYLSDKVRGNIGAGNGLVPAMLSKFCDIYTVSTIIIYQTRPAATLVQEMACAVRQQAIICTNVK